MKTITTVLLTLILAGCSTNELRAPLMVEKTKEAFRLESSLDVALLVGGSIATAAGVDNYGTTHYVVTKGVGRIVEDWADTTFTHPNQEWAADFVSILGVGIAAAYWIDREDYPSLDNNNKDKVADAYLPLIPVAQTIWRRLRYTQ